MKRKTPIQVLKEWWWLYGVLATLVGGIVLWGSLPGRMAKAEGQIDDLKGWAKELQGYTRAQQEYNQSQQQQVAPQGLRDLDALGQCWACPVADVDACYAQELWKRCD